jgi:hypothetical protein
VAYASDGVHLNVDNLKGDPGNAAVKTLMLPSREKAVKRKNKATDCSRVSMPSKKKKKQVKAKPKAKDEVEPKAKTKANEVADSAPKDEAEPKAKTKAKEAIPTYVGSMNLNLNEKAKPAPKEAKSKAKAKEEADPAPTEEAKADEEAEPEASQNKTTVDIGIGALCPECKRPTTNQHACPLCKKSYHTICMLSFDKAKHKICKTCYELGAMSAEVRKWKEDVHLHDPFETGTPKPFDALTRDYFNVLSKDKQKDKQTKQKDKQTKQKDKQTTAPAAAALPEGVVNENAYRCVSFDTGVSCFRTGV